MWENEKKYGGGRGRKESEGGRVNIEHERKEQRSVKCIQLDTSYTT